MENPLTEGCWFKILAKDMVPEFLIVDIDETLGKSFMSIDVEIFKYKDTTPVIIYDGDELVFVWVPRPKAIEFLKKFVPKLKGWAIWTCGISKYAKAIVDKWLHPNDLFPDFVLSRNHCDGEIKNIKTMLEGIKTGSEKWSSLTLTKEELDPWKESATVFNSWILDDNFDHFSDKTHGILIEDYTHEREDLLFKQLIHHFDLD